MCVMLSVCNTEKMKENMKTKLILIIGLMLIELTRRGISIDVRYRLFWWRGEFEGERERERETDKENERNKQRH